MMRRAISKVQVVGLCAVLALLVASGGLSAAIATSPSSTSAPTACQSAIRTTYDSMDQATAVANAKASSLYSQGVASYYQPTFSSIFQIAKTVSTSTCEQQVESFNVVFVLHNSTGSIVANLVLSESQDLSILGSSIQPDHVTNGNIPKVNYAGYTVTPSTRHTIYTYATYIEYNQSKASHPSTACESMRPCEVSTWTGLTDSGNGIGNIVQDGTTAECGPSTTCTASYFAWYETVISSGGGAYVICNTGNNDTIVSSGDTIETNVINNILYSGSSSTYSINIDDVTSNTSCYAGDISFSTMTGPTWAEWITELPQDSGSDVSLAQFGTVLFTGLDFQNDSTGYNVAPYTAVQDGYYNTFELESGTGTTGYPPTCTGVVQNIVTSSMTSSSHFTNLYKQSTNTRAPCA